MTFKTPPHERVLARSIEMPIMDGGCILWMGATTPDGYGLMSVNGKLQYVHRIMARHAGMNVDDQTVDHLCRVRNCVNFRHLE
ncbi:hypothetical protein [Actinoplanes sp. URMC 104]|uniref:hypothetical protein n=1 Tax=Actinoplanes sp. URMC 104 TaxID=3423409 RepID=UPI003F1DB7B1